MDDQRPYGTPLSDQPDPKTGLTPNEEQVTRNRRLAAALYRFHATLNQPHAEADR